jgi:hypothetical protein
MCMVIAGPPPTERFTDRAASYARARPGYPDAIAPMLAYELALPEDAVVADLGSGTGLSCEPFLRAGFVVIGVEPNAAMRAMGERALAAHPRFRSVAGSAEATTLPAASVDLVIAAQAFHWFDVPRARAEALRILKRPANAALIWNDRIAKGSPFAEGYEQLLLEFGIDYAKIRHRHAHEEAVTAFFGGPVWRERRFANPTELNWELLVERMNSASYVPRPDAPGYAPMLARLRSLFDASQRDGRIVMAYDTRVFFGAIHAP